jgi:hypothetical protein
VDVGKLAAQLRLAQPSLLLAPFAFLAAARAYRFALRVGRGLIDEGFVVIVVRVCDRSTVLGLRSRRRGRR